MSTYPFRTALVTGASAGIGEEIARLLAADGVAVTLVARRRDRLEQLAAELPGSSVLVADLVERAGRNVVAARLEGAPVELLVNNAGFGLGLGLLDVSPSQLDAQLSVNVAAVIELSRAAARPMAAAGRGWIINLSSVAGELPTPYDAGYGASKAYVTSFSEAIAVELAPHGVRVTAVLPGYTRTEFHTVSGTDAESIPRWAWMSAEAVALAALAGAAAGRVVVVPGRGYQVATAAVRLLPRAALRRISGSRDR